MSKTNSNNTPKKQVPAKKKSHKSTFIILFVIVSVFGFTGLAIWLQFSGNVELSATLITCFYAFCTGELWMLASIKKAKIYKDVDNDGIPDDIDDFIDYSQVDNFNRGVEDALQKINELLNSEREDH
jgi:hypothetical protein